MALFGLGQFTLTLIYKDELKLIFLLRFGLGSLVYITFQLFAIIIDFSTY